MRKVLTTAAATLTMLAASVAVANPRPLLDIKPYAITMSVPNLEATAAWYDEILGFKIEKTKDYPEFKTRLAFLQRGGFRVELIEDANAKPGIVRADAPAHTATHGVAQFIFETTDLATVKARLTAKRIHIHFEFENKELGAKFFFIRDPNQNLIAFLQRL
jgi:methylmalonyl-CoA/ethylmalonyl-CoA epimerase